MPVNNLFLCAFVLWGASSMIPGNSLNAQPREAAEPPAQGAPPVTQEAPLRQRMLLIQAVLSRIFTATADSASAHEALADVVELQLRIVEAKRATPPRFGDLDEEAQQTHDLAYREMLARALAAAAELEIAVIERSEEKIAAAFALLNKLRVSGHGAFQPPRRAARDTPRPQLADKVALTEDQRCQYVGEYEFGEVGFRVIVVDREGALFIETFGNPPERLYALGEHRFQIAAAASAEVRFEIGDVGVAQAIILSAGGERPPQRIERVR